MDTARCGRRRDESRRLAVVRFQSGAFFLIGFLGENLAGFIFGLARIFDLDAFPQAIVDFAERELVDDGPWQQAGIAHGLDFDLAQHLRDNVFDVLVVDVDALAAVNALHLADEVVLHRFNAADAEDVVGHERAVHERVAFFDVVTGMDAKVLAMGHEVVAFGPDRFALVVHGLNEDGAFAAPFLAEANEAGDLGHDGGLAGAACLKDFGDSRQATGDVLRAADLARRFRHQGTGRDLLVLTHFQVGLFRDVVES